MLLLAAIALGKGAARLAAAPRLARAAPPAADWLAGVAKHAVGFWATSRAVLVVSATAAQATAACPPLVTAAAVQGAALGVRAWLGWRRPAPRGKGGRALRLLAAAAPAYQPHRMPADQVSKVRLFGMALFWQCLMAFSPAMSNPRSPCCPYPCHAQVALRGAVGTLFYGTSPRA